MASIRIRQDKNGSLCYQVTCCIRDADGKRHSLSRTWRPDPSWSDEKTQTELSAFAASFESEINGDRYGLGRLSHGTVSNPARFPTLHSFYERTFRPEKARLSAENTVLAYDQLEKALESTAMWEMPLPSIRPFHIQDFLMALLSSGLQVSSVNLRRNQLNVIFGRAVELELLVDNPVDKVKPFKRPKDVPVEEQRSLTLDEAVRYLNIADQFPLLWRTLLWLALDSGMRRGELRGLRWGSIDFQNGIIAVENNYQHGKDCLPKSGKVRSVQIGDTVVSLLQQLRDSQPNVTEYVFANPETGKPYDEETVGRVMKEVGDAIGCPWLHCHSLRHTMATLGLAGGASLSGVSKRLGHQNTSTTSRYYVHPDNRESNEAGQCLRQLLGRAMDKP